MQVTTDCVCRKDGRSWMSDLSQSIKRCSMQIMKQLFAACFDSDAVSLPTENVVHHVLQESSSIVCLSILSACSAYQHMLSLQAYHDHCCLLCWSSRCLICTCPVIRLSWHALLTSLSGKLLHCTGECLRLNGCNLLQYLPADSDVTMPPLV